MSTTLQNLIVYLAVLAAVVYTLYSLLTTIKPQKSRENAPGCAGNCKCDAVEMKKSLNRQRKAREEI